MDGLLQTGTIALVKFLRGPNKGPTGSISDHSRSTASAIRSDAHSLSDLQIVAINARVEVKESLQAIWDPKVLGNRGAGVTRVCAGNAPACVGVWDSEGEADGCHEEGKNLGHLNGFFEGYNLIYTYKKKPLLNRGKWAGPGQIGEQKVSGSGSWF